MARRIAVLGGGAAGVVAATELARRGASVEIFERAPVLGGLHRSVVIDGDAFDIGVFVFHRGHALVTAFPSLQHLFVPAVVTLQSLTPTGYIDAYPVSLRGYVASRGLPRTARATASLIAGRLSLRSRDSVPAFASHYMGRFLYEDTGLRDYIERLYGVPDHEVGIEFAEQRLDYVRTYLPEMVRRTVRRAVRGGATPPKQPSLVRPRAGFGELYDGIARELRQQGVTVRLNEEVLGLGRRRSGFEIVTSAGASGFDAVISTLPAALVMRFLGESDVPAFEHVNLLSVFYRGDFVPKAPVVCNFTHSGKWKRVCAFSRYYGSAQQSDYLTAEITTLDASPDARARLIADFEEHAMRFGLFRSEPRRVGETLTPRAYPVFRKHQRNGSATALEKVQAVGIHLVGRQGNHQYLSSHQAASQAQSLAQRIPLH